MISYILAYLYHAILARLAAPPPPPRRHITLGTRDSLLAMVQTDMVMKLLQQQHPDLDIARLSIKTAGDKNLVVPLYLIQGKSLWTSELEDMLLSRTVDVVVHSLKDMPTVLPPTCHLAAILEREDPRDAFVARAGSTYKSLSELPRGAIVGSSSVRRMAQIKRLYPDLVLIDCRGNVPSRLRKLDNIEADPRYNYDALILAAAGLLRIDLGHRITQYLDAPDILHAVGQGALGIEIRAGDEETTTLLKGLTHHKTANACFAERELLRTLEGGCSVPIGVKTAWRNDELRMLARVCSVDGKELVETDMKAVVTDQASAERFGHEVAQQLISLGCGPILKRIEKEKKEAQDREREAAAAVSAEQSDQETLGESVVLVEVETESA